MKLVILNGYLRNMAMLLSIHLVKTMILLVQ
nr:MAG TPA_asm: hypothetical protein [Caudoviricetes sp.]